ncbi:methyltransferase domain-containing protein [Stenoxybacter acetivorans]|uniref:methyltransferase domain-containing protein n=1 Tax=Stenoxybacter acetivorans TaxID=422441 RepID=UPI0005679532|nr:methyltransferase domain-containing protein [Stenoxybacter acetivorans]
MTENSLNFNNVDWFLQAHLAAVTDARLAAVKKIPQEIVLAGADGDESYRRLSVRYPQARFTEYDARADCLQAALKRRKAAQNLWQKFTQALPAQTASHRLPETESADMVWSNLGLLAQDNPIVVFENWAAALKPNGMLFFTHLGAGSLKEILAIRQGENAVFHSSVFMDMHDLGDMLFHHGFYDPVMDMDTLTLRYAAAERLIADLQTIGVWSKLYSGDKSAAISALTQAFAKGECKEITLELVYGHALKKIRLPENTAEVRFYPAAKNDA